MSNVHQTREEFGRLFKKRVSSTFGFVASEDKSFAGVDSRAASESFN